MKILMSREKGSGIWFPTKYPDLGEEALVNKAKDIEHGRRRSLKNPPPNEYAIAEVEVKEVFEV